MENLTPQPETPADMPVSPKAVPAETPPAAVTEPEMPAQPLPPPPRLSLKAKAVILLATYAVGLLSGFLVWGLRSVEQNTSAAVAAAPTVALTATPVPVLPAEYALPVSFGDLGPKLIEAGAIDYEKFIQVYQRSGNPLSDEQLTILSKGSDAPIVFNRHNAYFLLNFFWAVGLTNQSSLLTDGPMVQNSGGNVARFASTGGWTIGAKPVTELYASAPIVPLTPEQTGILAAVASAVYRPCCNNPTAFPDCNHGMAMLGMLELLAANGATEDEMFEAAKYANAFWFPQQSEEIATFFRNAKNVTFEQADARDFVGPYVASSSGFQAVHQWLTENNLLPQAPSSGNSCGV